MIITLILAPNSDHTLVACPIRIETNKLIRINIHCADGLIILVDVVRCIPLIKMYWHKVTMPTVIQPTTSWSRESRSLAISLYMCLWTLTKWFFFLLLLLQSIVFCIHKLKQSFNQYYGVRWTKLCCAVPPTFILMWNWTQLGDIVQPIDGNFTVNTKRVHCTYNEGIMHCRHSTQHASVFTFRSLYISISVRHSIVICVERIHE